MPNLTLASAPITNADRLVVELVTPPDAPVVVLLHWPGGGAPSVSDPRRFPATALAVIAVMDDAMVALHAIEL
jgi:hypothetical protein